MRYTVIIFFLLPVFQFSYAQTSDTASGFYVTLTNDTINVQVKMPKSMFSGNVLLPAFLSKVQIVDSDRTTYTFKPGDIKGYGFTYNGTDYKFYSPACATSFRKFLQAVIIGKKTSLYTYQTVDTYGRSLGAVYTFEKADGACTFLNIAEKRLEVFKSKLNEFYKNDLGIQELINTKFQTRSSLQTDMIAIVEAVNKL